MKQTEILDRIKKLLDTDSIIEYYNTHNQLDTMKHFNIESKTCLRNILKELNYDFSYKRKHSLFKGKKSPRSHESYVKGGKKSSETQKESWNNKTVEEKENWSQKQKESHSSEEVRNKLSEINKKYQQSLSEEEKQKINQSRSDSMKSWWNNLSEEERKNEIKKHFDGGAGWNKETIRKTVHERYGVNNISQLESLKPVILESIINTCREKYGVDYSCQLPQCSSAIGSKSYDTKPNRDFNNLLIENFHDFYAGEIGTDREFALGKYKYDFKVKNTLIEINPFATHNSTWSIRRDITPLSKYYHKDKTEFAKSNGYRCINVWDWDEPNKIIELLSDRETIYARRCEIKHVERKQAIMFLNSHHCQNFARCSIMIGLYFNNELISIMTFGKPRFNRKYDYELIRYCSIKNVVGGAEKLLSHFIKEYHPQTIISYCDNSKFDGGIYRKLGFELISSGRPSLHWYNPKTKEHYTNSIIVQQGFSRIVNHCDASHDNLNSSDNKSLMIENGFVEIYDCGQSSYVLISC